MVELSENQEELRQSIQKSATIWAIVLGVILALLAYWLLGSQGAPIRLGVAAIVGAGAGFLMFRQVFGSKAKEAKCTQCSAVFSTSRSDSTETLVDRQEKEKREQQDDGSIKYSRWTEEKYEVVDTYKCSKCGYESTRQSQVTRRKDEESIVEQPHGKVAQVSTKSASSRTASGKTATPGGSQASATKATSPAKTKGPAKTARPARKQKGTGRGKSRS